MILASFSLANREGLNLPDDQLLTVCRGKPMSSKAWRVFLDMYIFMVGILHERFSRVNKIIVDNLFRIWYLPYSMTHHRTYAA